MILLAYYGDDFTGSTDVLEALTASGVATVLFTEPPSERDAGPVSARPRDWRRGQQSHDVAG